MANSLSTTDIFKFMSVRSAKKAQAQANNPLYIKDQRMNVKDKPLNGEVFLLQDYDKDGIRLWDEIFTKVFDYDSRGKTSTNIRNDIATLLDSFEANPKTNLSEDGISEKNMVDDFLMVINKYKVNFDRCRLTHDIECIIKEFSDVKSVTLYDFVNINNVNSNKTSWFYKIQEELFNRLYILYIFKRRYTLNLEYVLSGLRALNIIYWLEHDNRIEPCYTEQQTASGCGTVFTSLFSKKNRPASDKSVKGKNFSKVAADDCNYKEADKIILNSATELNSLFSSSVAINPILSSLYFYNLPDPINIPFNSIKPIGIGDLLIVREKLCRYEAGEIAHIENVLKGESKERIHRRLDRLEDIFTREQEQTQESTKDTQTTDRFEVKKEIDNTVNEDMQVNVNASGSISGSYGVVQYNAAASAGFSYGRSATDATRSSSNYAKEIVDRSVTKVQNKIREERTTKKINEVEETNKHAINNEKGTGNISGIYRYVDKRYKSQLYNYGKRTMYEFIIPEPAFFFKSVFEKIKNNPEPAGEKPTAPDRPQLTIGSITQDTIDIWSVKFNLTTLKPEPSSSMTINEALTKEAIPTSSVYEEAIPVKEGYYTSGARVYGSYITNDSRNCYIQVNVGFVGAMEKRLSDQGGGETDFSSVTYGKLWLYDQFHFTTGSIEGKINISIITNDIASFAFNVTITCLLKNERKLEWQIDTYNRIMDAYENAYKDYENKLVEYNNKKESINAQNSGIEIKGRNPAFNEEIIKAEFKKHCITLITKDYDTVADADFVSTIKAIGDRTIPGVTPVVPAINIAETRKSAPFIQFMEQAFEWRNLTYLLYSYLWHTEDKWPDTFKSYDETDPLFGAFLRAGSARVLVPVHPNYETSVLQFLYTGVVWNGGEAPAIDDDKLYIPIHEEIRNQQDDLNGAIPQRDKDGNLITWEYVVPTPLVYLQDSSELPVFDCTTK